jgi:hypothetical protein
MANTGHTNKAVQKIVENHNVKEITESFESTGSFIKNEPIW